MLRTAAPTYGVVFCQRRPNVLRGLKPRGGVFDFLYRGFSFYVAMPNYFSFLPFVGKPSAAFFLIAHAFDVSRLKFSRILSSAFPWLEDISAGSASVRCAGSI